MRASVFLHVDMDAFFTSIEQRDRPGLKGRPVVVGARPDERGVVAAASYEARRFGVRSAMPSSEAGRLCPQAVFLPPDRERYEAVSRRIMSILERYTPLVEPLSIDEAFLDVTGSRRLFGDGPAIAVRIKRDIREETSLTASVGVAPNKFLAKVASDLEKPDGLTVVPEGRDEIVRFLAPLRVERVWGVGRVTARQLHEAGVRVIGDLQRIPEIRLASAVGRHTARHLLALAWGEDAREVELDADRKQISREHTFGEDCADREQVRNRLMDLVDDVGTRLRHDGRYAGTAHLKLRWKGFETLTRQRPFPFPVNDDFTLREMADRMFEHEEMVKPVRLVGFGVSRLVQRAERQLGLFTDAGGDPERRSRLSEAVDAIRDDLGPDSIGRTRDPCGKANGPVRDHSGSSPAGPMHITVAWSRA